MDCSIKEQKIQAMKNYKRAKFLYNFVLYSTSSIITCFFFSYPFWSPSMNHFLSYVPKNISFLLNAKCFFIVGNLIVLILIGESKLKQSSSSTSDIHDEYVARSRNSYHVNSKEINRYKKNLNIEEKKHGQEEKIYHEGKKKEMRVCKSSIPHHEEKKKRMRSCKSEVWGESEIVKMEKTKGKEEEIVRGENSKGVKEGMRSCKSEVWGESEIVKMEKSKGKEEELYKSSKRHDQEKKMGMKSCKSEVWGESEIFKREKTKGEQEESYNSNNSHEEKKMGMRSCKSEIWGEGEIVNREKNKGKEEEQFCMPNEELNRRVEAFIARVNKQRLLEAKLVDHGRG